MLSVIIVGVVAAAAVPSSHHFKPQAEVPAITRNHDDLFSYFVGPYNRLFDSQDITLIGQQEQEASWPEKLSEHVQVRATENEGPLTLQTRDDPARREPLVDKVGSTISWVLEDSKGQEYRLTVAQEEYLRTTVGVDISLQTRYLETRDGSIIAVRDYSQYVQTTAQLSQLADEIYENAGNDYQFVYEVWYIVTHMTDYAHEDIENVDFPLETLFKSRGDCEDLTILMASIIGASSHTKDWDIKIAYFDASNPADSNAVNHVALFIQTDQFSTFVESTNSELNGLSVWKRVDGWYVDVNRSEKQSLLGYGDRESARAINI